MIQGVRIISFTHYLQGPSGVQMLADLGADVIKVEPPDGAYERRWAGAQSFVNGESVFFLLANRNQRSLSVDIKSTDGQEIIRRLIETADVLVENFRPGVMDRLGFGYEDCKRINSQLVYASCSGYGTDGPYKDRPGQDLLIQAISGLAAISGQRYSPPTPAGTAIVDQHGAALLTLGVLAALLERSKTGIGRKVEVNLLNAALDLQIESLTYYVNNGKLQERSGSGLASTFHEAPYGVYETKDGAWLVLSLGKMAPLAQALDIEELMEITPVEQFDDRERIASVVRDAIKQHTRSEWEKRFTANGIWFAPVNEYSDVVHDPQVSFNDVFETINHPNAGPVTLMHMPVRFDGMALPIEKYPPRLGEHSKEVLLELGYCEDRISEMIESGSIKVLEKLWRGDFYDGEQKNGI